MAKRRKRITCGICGNRSYTAVPMRLSPSSPLICGTCYKRAIVQTKNCVYVCPKCEGTCHIDVTTSSGGTAHKPCEYCKGYGKVITSKPIHQGSTNV
jgi:hypothetical protein